MKAKLLFDQEITNPALKSLDDLSALRAKLHAGVISATEYDAGRKCLAVAGTVIDNPQAFGLVLMGIAEPADQECIDRVGQARLRRMSLRVDAAEKLDVAQATGTKADATDEQVADFKRARAERRKKLDVVEGTVTV